MRAIQLVLRMSARFYHAWIPNYIYSDQRWASAIFFFLCNYAILRTTKTIAELRTKKSCGIAIADLQYLTSTIPQLFAVSGQFSYYIVPFLSSGCF
jgi:hypothetical protein